jgi:hypothetical protein
VWCFIVPLCFTTLLPSQVPFCPLLLCCSFMLCYCSVLHCSFAQIGTPFCRHPPPPPSPPFCSVLEIRNCLGGSLEASKLAINSFCFFWGFSFLDLFLDFYFTFFFPLFYLVMFEFFFN